MAVADGKLQAFQNANGKIVYPVMYKEGATYLPVRAINNLMEKAGGKATAYFLAKDKISRG